MQQIVRVQSDEVDGDVFGREWKVQYVLYLTQTDEGTPVYHLYDDDGQGNGSFICQGNNLNRMRALVLRLGMFLQWGA